MAGSKSPLCHNRTPLRRGSVLRGTTPSCVSRAGRVVGAVKWAPFQEPGRTESRESGRADMRHKTLPAAAGWRNGRWAAASRHSYRTTSSKQLSIGRVNNAAAPRPVPHHRSGDRGRGASDSPGTGTDPRKRDGQVSHQMRQRENREDAGRSDRTRPAATGARKEKVTGPPRGGPYSKPNRVQEKPRRSGACSSPPARG